MLTNECESPSNPSDSNFASLKFNSAPIPLCVTLIHPIKWRCFNLVIAGAMPSSVWSEIRQEDYLKFSEENRRAIDSGLTLHMI